MTASMQQRTQKLGHAPVGRLLFQLGIPGMISMFIMTLYNITDTFWVAKLGPDAIAALTVIFPYQMLLVAIGVGSGAGFSSLIARRFGEGKHEETNHIAGQVFPLTVIFGLLFALVTTFFPRPFLNLLGATSDIFPLAYNYLFFIGFGAGFTFFSMMSNNIFRGSGNTLAPMIFMAVGAILNILLDPFFIFGLAFFPAWGVKGAAVATLISQGCAASLSLFYLLCCSGYRFRLAYLIPHKTILLNIYQVGFPTFIMQTVGSIVMTIANHILGGFGAHAIAANGLVFRLMGLIVMPIAGLAQGLMPIVGYNYGAKKIPRLWRAVKIASISSFAIIGVGYLFLQLFPAFWISLFTRDESFLPLATHAARVATCMLPLMGPPFMWITTFQGLGKGRAAMLISLSRQLIFLLPCILILPRIWGLNGLWISIPVSDLLAFIIAGLWVRKEYQFQIKTEPPATGPTPDTFALTDPAG
ncbi:MATE family efflux transporter [bacterium]|nr:MATE family efflux transporter [bacterium]